ncbi:complex I NDUFA9 subunit family protein [Sphingomonas sp. HDW15A]|uniref:complex I NDUFA9 subunit family protein n=1 Tax=Sphingomonas sp. HDW15A TaxID=2714942 RepID=UPI0014096500|nr:complex I NDUFA9 subunit family protein [Sphingomonas sp. HDW15A]QIK96667.1 complex I NDUFA9 subunit family protein [Sphingomonas sp. HDW15A]
MPLRSSPPLVTVFGGGGFIGRYVCEYLLKSGARVRVAQRHPRKAFFLQPLGQVGQIDFVAADVTKPASVELAVAGADAVVNLVAVFGRGMTGINVDGAVNIARASAAAGCKALVHVSAIGADPNGKADYAQSKGRGEAGVRAAFPDATIIRPSLVFGPEDQLTNRFASLLALLPFYPVIAPDTKFQPVFVRDLSQAVAVAALDPPKHRGKTYEIGGPDVMTMRALTAEIGRLAGHPKNLIDMPTFASSALARLGFLPGAPLTWDQWLMLQQDNIAAKKSKGLAEFGITPTPLSAVAGEWLGRFREGGRFRPRAESLGTS